MNERIRELAVEAGLSHMPSNYPDMADLYKGADFELEKFAELIVKECAEQIELMRKRVEEYGPPPGYDSDTFRLAYNDSIDTIKEHFGVE